MTSPLLDDPSDLSALRATGADPDELFASFAAWAAASGTVLYPAQEEALIELVSGANVVLATPTGSGKSLVATGALYAALAAGPAQLLHRTDQGAGQREVLRPVRGVRRGQRRHAHRRRLGQRGRADHRLHRGGPGQHRPARGSRRRHRPGGDGRVPLLRRPRPRLGVAGAAAGTAARTVPADVGHPRRRHVPARGPHPSHRPRRPRWSPTPNGRSRCSTTTRPRRCTRPSTTCSTPSRRRSTSCTSPRPPRWSGRRR